MSELKKKELHAKNVTLNLSIQLDSKDLGKKSAREQKATEQSQSQDEDSEKIQIFQNPEGKYAGLKITKLLVVTGLSLLDVFTDFLFGFSLLFDFENRWTGELKAEAAAHGYVL